MRFHTRLINLLYPPACLLCHSRLGEGESEQVLCGACRTALPASRPPVCAQCGIGIRGAFDAVMPCAACRTHPPVFERARAPWQYRGPIERAVRQFKYHRRWRVGAWLADTMAAEARSSLPLQDIAAVLPVPLHWVKRWLRGSNPPEQLASPIARSLQKPLWRNAVRRTRWTATQTRLRGAERRRNVQEAFAADPRAVCDRTVLLVDDVMTTGATADACALALKRAGARRVFVLTAARTPLQ